MQHAHWSDEDLIELALNERVEAALSALCPQCAARLEAWRGHFVQAREQFDRATPVDPARLCALAESVLAQTTRSVPAHAVDPRFTRRMRRVRLARALTRSLAAGLLVGAALLAYMLSVKEAAPELLMSSLTPGDNSPVRTLGPEGPERVPAGLGEFEPPLVTTAAETIVGRILGSRGDWLRERTPIQAQALPGLNNDATARALFCEHVLDRFALAAELPEHFDSGIRAMLAATTEDRAERRLELAALARARDYGLLDAREEGNLGDALARAGVDAAHDPLFAAGSRRNAPIDTAWLGAMSEVLESPERCDPVVKAWLALR